MKQQTKMEKREYNSEKENLDNELSQLMAITLRLEDELNLMN
jgi:hypothetical protein